MPSPAKVKLISPVNAGFGIRSPKKSVLLSVICPVFIDFKILPSKLNIGVMKPSKVPKAEPRPSVSNIKKNKTAQNGPPGITAIASATAIKAKPVP